jgi:hypothetical protein
VVLCEECSAISAVPELHDKLIKSLLSNVNADFKWTSMILNAVPKLRDAEEARAEGAENIKIDFKPFPAAFAANSLGSLWFRSFMISLYIPWATREIATPG